MFPSMRRSPRHRGGVVAVDIAPLIDMVFILLIFFLVTSTFQQDRGLDLQRPTAVESRRLDPTTLRIHITADGTAYIAGEETPLDTVEIQVRRFLTAGRQRAVVIVPDGRTSAANLVAVMDRATRGGARDLAVATRELP